MILSFSVVTFAVCDSSFQLQDAVLAVSDLRQRVIARDQSARSPVWRYQSRCYICLLSICNNFKYQIYVLGEFELFDLRAFVTIVIYMSVVDDKSYMSRLLKHGICACLVANESSRLGWLLIAHWFFINFIPWLSLGFAQFIFSVTFPCVIFFSTPPITFLMVRPSVIRVKSRLFSPLPG